MGPYEETTSSIREQKVDPHDKKIGRTWKNFALYECTRIGEDYKEVGGLYRWEKHVQFWVLTI